MADLLLTIDQVAERLQIHPASVRRQLRGGLLRGVKRGKLWRVPESALYETTRGQDRTSRLSRETEQAHAIWDDMNSAEDSRRDTALRALFRASDGVQAIVRHRSAEAASCYYATPAGDTELTDWRAFDGEPFQDDGDGL